MKKKEKIRVSEEMTCSKCKREFSSIYWCRQHEQNCKGFIKTLV